MFGRPTTPDLSANPVLALGHVTPAANRVHFLKNARDQPGCPSRAPACEQPAYLVPDDQVIISKLRGDALALSDMRRTFICATYINAKGGAQPGWLPADAVASDQELPAGSDTGTITTTPFAPPRRKRHHGEGWKRQGALDRRHGEGEGHRRDPRRDPRCNAGA
jgi:hypothetical protein